MACPKPTVLFRYFNFWVVPYSFRSRGHGLGFRALSFPVARVRQVAASAEFFSLSAPRVYGLGWYEGCSCVSAKTHGRWREKACQKPSSPNSDTTRVCILVVVFPLLPVQSCSRICTHTHTHIRCEALPPNCERRDTLMDKGF